MTELIFNLNVKKEQFSYNLEISNSKLNVINVLDTLSK